MVQIFILNACLYSFFKKQVWSFLNTGIVSAASAGDLIVVADANEMVEWTS